MKTKKRAGGLWQARTTQETINNLNQLTEKLNITKGELLAIFETLVFDSLINIYLQCREKAKNQEDEYHNTIENLSADDYKSFISRAFLTAINAWKKQGLIDDKRNIRPTGEIQERPNGEQRKPGDLQEQETKKTKKPGKKQKSKTKALEDREIEEILNSARAKNPLLELRAKQTKADIKEGKIEKSLGDRILKIYDSKDLIEANLQTIMMEEIKVKEAYAKEKQDQEERAKETADKKRQILEAYAKGEIDEAERDRQIGNLPF